jgi:NAD(P)-dependent dehydrogenase (short-subunit alcohol dehydrogenase family)
MKKNVLITGSNKGIGYETARQLGLLGFKIFISGRNENSLNEACTNLANLGIDVSKLLIDVSDLQSIYKAEEKFSKLGFKIDVLINNAAILIKEDNSIFNMNTNLIEETIQTNCYGPINVTRTFLKHLNPFCRVINVSSGGGSMTDEIGGWSPFYCVSKSLLNSITRQMAYELKEKHISVNGVCPSWVKTDMGGQFATRMVSEGSETIVWLANEAPNELTGKFFRDKIQIPW